jgi:hypothetical protein
MSVVVERSRESPDEYRVPTGARLYVIRTPAGGPITIEGLEDALFRCLDGTRASRYGDGVLVSRDDLIYPLDRVEPVC